MKLAQGQLWQADTAFIRIVHLERLEVEYKLLASRTSGDGEHQHTSKKDFCRLLKGARLLPTAKNAAAP